jgi:hypothetical protein
MNEDPTSPATGTITSTFAPINALTNSSGVVTDTRTWGADQAIEGWARKSSASPYYKTGPITGTIDKDTGLILSMQLLGDE